MRIFHKKTRRNGSVVGFILLVVAMLLWPATSTVAAGAVWVNVWTRAPGDFATSPPKPSNETRLDLAPLATTQPKSADSQYRNTGTYKGITLSDLIAKALPRGSKADLVLLHFDNGMLIPVPTTLPPEFANAMIATQIWSEARKQWSQTFPPARFDNESFRDARPVQFKGNKLVVPAIGDKKFSPWLYVSSLVGLEFVQKNAYERQFDVGTTAAEKAGLKVFVQNCQFCHGARNVGAKLGWDYVVPYPIYQYRSSGKKLLFHVKYQTADARARGILMPALSHITDADTDVMWQWLKAVGTKPLNSYKTSP